MSKLALAIATQEGFFTGGSLPQRNNNPGDLRHGPGEVHPDNQPNVVGAFDTPEDGWAALERQLSLDGERGMTVQDLIYSYAPPSDDNDTEAYINFVCQYVPCRRTDLVTDLLR